MKKFVDIVIIMILKPQAAVSVEMETTAVPIRRRGMSA